VYSLLFGRLFCVLIACWIVDVCRLLVIIGLFVAQSIFMSSFQIPVLPL
jgi:hypothetical protein